jgi:succinate dehydrogenase/fumarate reductase flavoprotein subunit
MNTLTTDVLIIGGGAAGLRAAIAARQGGVNVLVASKTMVGYANNTAVANGRIGGALGQDDSPSTYYEDIMRAGCNLNDPRLLSVFCQQASRRIEELAGFGAPLARDATGLQVTQSPGHSRPRIVWLAGGMGYTMGRALRDFAQNIGVRFAEGLLLSQVLQTGDQAAGAVGLDRRGEPVAIRANATVLAGGGAGQVFARTNNPLGMTGDGYALALRAGLPLRDMEFVQFYPTGLVEPGLPIVTIYYERLLAAEGARVLNAQGEDVLVRHGIASHMLATRDALARAFAVEIAEGRGQDGGLVFDLSAVPSEVVKRNLRSLAPALRSRSQYRVAPVVHFLMGGVEITPEAATGLPGLYAAGEVTGGLHGANRLASNALAETLVFGAIAGENAALWAKTNEPAFPMEQAEAETQRLLSLTASQEGVEVDRSVVRTTVWQAAGPVRTAEGMQAGLSRLAAIQANQYQGHKVAPSQRTAALELENMMLVGEAILRPALARNESRGAHYRADAPTEDPAWQRSLRVAMQGGKIGIV